MGFVGSLCEGKRGAAPMPGRSTRILSSAALTGGEIGTAVVISHEHDPGILTSMTHLSG